MDLYKAIRVRRSIRRYKAKQVEEAKLSRILEAGRLSPSAANRQPWHFIVVTDPEVKENMRESYGRDWFSEAPLVIVVCVDPKTAWVRGDGEEFWKIDGTIALQTMILQATEEGLGTCWIGAFDEAAAKKVLGIPPDIRVVAMTPPGYLDEVKGEVTQRKRMDEIVHKDRW